MKFLKTFIFEMLNSKANFKNTKISNKVPLKKNNKYKNISKIKIEMTSN